jgi:hypothetical protein
LCPQCVLNRRVDSRFYPCRFHSMVASPARQFGEAKPASAMHQEMTSGTEVLDVSIGPDAVGPLWIASGT